jgi:hypothetical protein
VVCTRRDASVERCFDEKVAVTHAAAWADTDPAFPPEHLMTAMDIHHDLSPRRWNATACQSRCDPRGHIRFECSAYRQRFSDGITTVSATVKAMLSDDRGTVTPIRPAPSRSRISSVRMFKYRHHFRPRRNRADQPGDWVDSQCHVEPSGYIDDETYRNHS